MDESSLALLYRGILRSWSSSKSRPPDGCYTAWSVTGKVPAWGNRAEVEFSINCSFLPYQCNQMLANWQYVTHIIIKTMGSPTCNRVVIALEMVLRVALFIHQTTLSFLHPLAFKTILSKCSFVTRTTHFPSLSTVLVFVRCQCFVFHFLYRLQC